LIHRVHPNTSSYYESMSSTLSAADNFVMELQRPADVDTTGRSERAKWLLNSPDPPPPLQELFTSIRDSVLPPPKSKKVLRPHNRCFFFLQGLFPILKWGRNYKATKFKNDFIAGLTLASLCIPQSIGYASLAKLDPQYGLYTSVVPPLIYALMGSSREIAIGPVAVISLLLSAMISKVIDPSTDPVNYTRFVFTVTFFTGTFQALFGFFRLGFLVDFLSHAAIVGFIGGAAIVIGLQQLKGLFGISHFTTKTDLVSVLGAVVNALHHHQEAIAVGRSLASLKGYHLDGNKEMVAMGFMNVIGSFTSCYTATGSFSRSAVNFSAGCETVVSNIVMAITVLICLLLFTKLLYYTPLAILASIILSALPGLIDLNEAYNIWKVDKLDFIICIGAFFGVLFGSVEIGLLLAVFISFAKIILNSIKPSTEVLGRLPGTDIFCNMVQYPMAIKISGILVVHINSGLLCFANANFIRERILNLVVDENGVEGGGLRVLVLDMTNVMNIDTSGIHAMEELQKKLISQGVELAVANPNWQVINKMKASKFIEKIGSGWIFQSVADAVNAFCMYQNECP
ncbi:hypothetical protein RD792_000572, partial [Penstemon davidsonii]